MPRRTTKEHSSSVAADALLGRIVRSFRGILIAHVVNGKKKYVYRPFGTNKKYEGTIPEDVLTAHSEAMGLPDMDFPESSDVVVDSISPDSPAEQGEKGPLEEKADFQEHLL